MRDAVAPGVSTAKLDSIAEEVIRSAGATPSFLGYLGYPASICSSVNNQVVHAIPSANQVLHEGDLISIDCGAVLDGWHGDAAITVGVGEVARSALHLTTAAEDALWAGIAMAAKGTGQDRGDSPTSRGRWRTRSSARVGSASSTATAVTASAPRCIRIRTCSTTAGPAVVPAWCRVCASPSSR